MKRWRNVPQVLARLPWSMLPVGYPLPVGFPIQEDATLRVRASWLAIPVRQFWNLVMRSPLETPELCGTEVTGRPLGSRAT